ncbi:hypothetical protein Q9Q94_13470 [Uliginosibacterium sp. 31-16]|uniref:hypothetical protein n=1 Tax=Uliginosibacterium sp. 31-16 TaxID=3068315 RepID=UPI00273EBDD9|nr:hypothetical protein [Uliginosibacterium sp. 31-16]MDP5240548.1 hypothetical protein [Uliginosibacterium sp. 31-16]
MLHPPHGECKVYWCDQACFAVLQGSFNREGVLVMTAAIQQAWRDAGQPGHWAHVMDLHLWQGGTQSGFAASHDLLVWATSHGAHAILRIHTARFLARVTENQGVFNGIEVPVVTLNTREQAWEWLSANGFECDPRKLLETVTNGPAA